MEETYTVIPDDFERAGAASTSLKGTLKQLGLPPELIRRIAIGTYEGEMNCLIHGGGGTIRAQLAPQAIQVIIEDHGPGIPDVQKAMQEGWSTASEKSGPWALAQAWGCPT